jgi:hypothetical protein
LLLEPGCWQARGTFFDAVGNGCPLAGDMRITHSAEGWHSEVAMSAELKPATPLSGSYEIAPFKAREGATSWRSLNHSLGELRGHIALVGEVMISGFSSADHRHSGASYLRQISRDRYHNRGYLISNGALASSWSVELLRIQG